MEVYLDNSATTRCAEEVREYMNKVFDAVYGNPSSMHHKGFEAENEVRRAREIIAKSLKVNEQEILFTSGGTESDNLSILGVARNNSNLRRGKHLISTRIEHPAVLGPLSALKEEGYEVTLLEVDASGRVDPAALREALREDTLLVSVMYTNNEIGSVQPLEELAAVIREKNPETLFHVDAVQGYGKAEIYPKKTGIDLLSVSAHKLHGPKGVGFLYINGYAGKPNVGRVKLTPLLYGGGQQGGLRSGTENVQGIAGMGKAVELVFRDLSEDIERLYELKAFFIEELQKIDGIARINGLPETGEERYSSESIGLIEAVRQTAPHIVSVSFEKIRAEVMLHALEEKGIYVSAGSACSSNKPAVSETLKAIGLPKELLDRTVRFSMSRETTKEELEYTLEALREIVPMLGRFVRR
ncbi:MAG: cysteine desulfurase [Lachnospiraceae bacterium]|nr:cysteine desulfurase [Lachnospiraceae bacterium]